MTPERSERGERVHRVIVAGGGFAGVYAALYLTRDDVETESLEVTLVSERNYFTFTPLLHDVVGGNLSGEHVSVPYRVLGARRGFRFLEARVEGLDPSDKQLHTTAGTLEYDYLILGLGSAPRVPGEGGDEGEGEEESGESRGVEGPEPEPEGPRPRTLTFHSVPDAVELHDRVIRLAERASRESHPETRRSLLTFVFAGGGPAGVEAAGEVHQLLAEVLPKYYDGLDEARVVLVHADDRILKSWDADLVAKGQDLLRSRGLDVRLNTLLQDYEGGRVVVSREGEEESIRAHTLVWTIGTRPRTDLLEGSELRLDDHGRVQVDKFLRARGRPSVFVVGDISALVNERTGKPYPPVAPIAISQGARAAANILSVIHGLPLEPYRAHHAGKIVSLGGGVALVDVLGWTFGGRPAWMVSRLTYLLKLVGTKNKLRAATTLLANRLFERKLQAD